MGIATRESAIAIGICFPILGAILIALRFYTRWLQKVPRQVDDWLCLPAWLCVTGCCASLLTGVFKGAFVDQPPASPDDVTEQQHILAQVTAAIVMFWMSADTLIKLSILFFYRRIFMGRVFNICTWVMIVLSVVWLIYTFFSWIFYCGTYLKEDFEGGWAICPLWGFDIQMGVFCLDSLIDLVLIILPVPFIWKLQLSLSRKLVVIFIFLIGGLAFVAGLNNTIVQLVYLTKPELVANAGQGNFFQGSSLLFSNWPTVEIGVGLIACNLPSLSFRAVHSLPKQVRRGWNLSWSGIRHAAAVLSLHSRPSHHEHGDTTNIATKNDAIALERYESSSKSLVRGGQRSLASTSIDVEHIV